MPVISQAPDFSEQVLNWFNRHGRRDLPWQKDLTHYRVWVSEVMLQQTQVNTVIPYFNNFIGRFVNIKTLAEADLDEVLYYWTGLGYYARARNLHHTARIIMEEHKGLFPSTVDQLMSLPGIGRSTAGAILALACNQRHPVLDGNVKRVLTRYHGIEGWPGQSAVERELWELAMQHTPEKNVADYTQAMMDLGATVCLRRHPRCEICPVSKDCFANNYSRQHGLPQTKPKNKMPVRKTIFAILENYQGKILLEHRPPAGIWGGLWAFPECFHEDDIQSWVETKFGYSINKLEYKAPIRHTFSHFHLDIMPVHASVKTRNSKINGEDRYCWYEPWGKKYLGMATPVKKLLQEITLNLVSK